MKITLKNFQSRTRIDPALIRKAAAAAIATLGLDKPLSQIHLCFVSDKMIKTLNQRYLAGKTATDVLAFDISRGPKAAIFADIIISVDTAKRNARMFSTSINHELCLYAVHGILHLSGYADLTAAQRKRMDKKAAGILAVSGINP